MAAIEEVLKFLDIVIRKTNEKHSAAPTLQQKVIIAGDLRKVERARIALLGLFYAFADYKEQGESFELPETHH